MADKKGFRYFRSWFWNISIWINKIYLATTRAKIKSNEPGVISHEAADASYNADDGGKGYGGSYTYQSGGPGAGGGYGGKGY